MNGNAKSIEALSEVHYHFLSLWPGFESYDVFGSLQIGNRLVPIPFRNHTSLVRAKRGDVRALIRTTSAYFEEVGALPAFQLDRLTKPQDFQRYLLAEGFHKQTEEAWMALAETTSPAQRLNPAVSVCTIEPEGDEQQVQAYIDCYNTSFHTPEQATRGFGQSFRGVLGDPAGVHYLALVDEAPAGAMSLFSEEGYGCVYNVGTFPEYRGQHIATTLFQRLLSDSEQIGNHTVFLQAVHGGPAQPIYARLGFRTCFIRQWYLPAPPGGIWS